MGYLRTIMDKGVRGRVTLPGHFHRYKYGKAGNPLSIYFNNNYRILYSYEDSKTTYFGLFAKVNVDVVPRVRSEFPKISENGNTAHIESLLMPINADNLEDAAANLDKTYESMSRLITRV